jgi:hypothetical protein
VWVKVLASERQKKRQVFFIINFLIKFEQQSIMSEKI